jgi:hypothetical protein
MGDIFSHQEREESNRAQTSGVASRSNVAQANSREDPSSLYYLVKLKGGGLLIEELKKAQEVGTPEAMGNFRTLVRQKLAPFLKNGKEGFEVPVRDLVNRRYACREHKRRRKSKQRFWKYNSVYPEVVAETGGTTEVPTRFRRVWWDIDKRGAVGETALHLCLLNNSSLYKDLAIEIIRELPGLVNDIYLGDLYYGESALHIAIVNGDYKMVKLLLENGAWVDEAAIGSFFYPIDQEEDRKDFSSDLCERVQLLYKETNYEGPCYFGEYPLMFAACHSQFNIVRLLMQYSMQRQHPGSKPMQEWQDANGNTVLHMMVISGLKHMYRFLLLEYHCNDQQHNDRGFSPLSLAAHLGKNDMFQFILRLKSIPLWSYGQASCALYPLDEIDTISCARGKEEKRLSVLSHIVNQNTVIYSEMIDGLIYEILRAKWKLYAKWRFFQQFVVFTVYVVLLTAALNLRPSKDPNPYNETSRANNTGNGSGYSIHVNTDSCYLRDCWEDATCIWRYCCEIGALCLSVIFLVFVGHRIHVQGWRNAPTILFQSPTELLFLMGSCLLVVLAVVGRAACFPDFEDVLVTVAVVLAWPFYLFFHRLT